MFRDSSKIVEPSRGVLECARSIWTFTETAVKLAASGKMRDCNEIQEALVEKGYRRVPELLSGDEIQTVLDLYCRRSRKSGN